MLYSVNRRRMSGQSMNQFQHPNIEYADGFVERSTNNLMNEINIILLLLIVKNTRNFILIVLHSHNRAIVPCQRCHTLSRTIIPYFNGMVARAARNLIVISL